MAAKILAARDTGKGYHIEIHLDITKTLADGVTPDPRYVGKWDWAMWDGTTGGTLAGYKAQVAAEVKLLAAKLLADINGTGGGVALPIEGTTF